jgi:threonine dehydrogenase-like Zn-dependent dehydrogenase
MKALATDGKEHLWMEEVPRPELTDYDCLVRTHSCLFCRTTDRHIVSGDFDFGLSYPVLLGHESIGQVVECGPLVRNFKPGDWVTRCYAAYPDERLGDYGSGWGGFAEYAKIRDHVAESTQTGATAPGWFRYMQKLPPGLDAETAQLIICQKEIHSAVAKLGILAGREFVVNGAGVAGLLFAVFLKLGGASRVAVAARRTEALEVAARLTPADEFLQIGGSPGRAPAFGEMIETTGSLEAMHQVARTFLTARGAIHSYAIYPEMGAADFESRLPAGHPVSRVDPDEASSHDAVCKLLMDGKITASGWIGSSFGIDDHAAAWTNSQSGPGIKTRILF